MSDEVQVELVDDERRPAVHVPPGGITSRLMFQVVDGGKVVARVVTGMTYGLLAERGVEGPEHEAAFIKDFAPEVIRRKYEIGDLEDLEPVDGETVVVDLTEFNVPPV